MSVQIGILQILASHPDGQASIASINADYWILCSSRAWSTQLRTRKRLAGTVEIFSSGLVERTAEGWRITAVGRAFLKDLDDKASAPAATPVLRVVASSAAKRSSDGGPSGQMTASRIEALRRLVNFRAEGEDGAMSLSDPKLPTGPERYAPHLLQLRNWISGRARATA
jgi:hypothetical protein